MTQKSKDFVLHRRIYHYLRLPNAAATALAAYFLLAFAVLQAPVLEDPDSAWHLAAGRWMIEHRALTTADPWAYTSGDQAWYNLSWLYDLIIGAVYAWGGLVPLWLTVMVAGAAMCGILVTLCFRAGGGFLASVAVVGLSGFILLAGTQLRPHWVSFYLAACFYAILQRERVALSPRLHWLLPPLMALWVNCHGAFPVGLSIIGAFWLEALHERRIAYAKRLTLVGVACMAAVFVNPYGPELFTGMLRTLDSVITKAINEWMPVAIGKTQILVTLHLALALVVLHVGTKRLKLADIVLAVFWILAGLSSVRYYFFAVILSAPALAVCLREALEGSRIAPRYRAKDAGFMADCGSANGRRNGALVFALAIMALALPHTRYLFWNAPIAYADSKAPAGLVSYLKEERAASRILNDYSMGGFLIFHAGDVLKVFIDGRAGTVYSEQVLKDYLDLVRYQPRAPQLLDDYRIDTVALRSDARLVHYLKTQPQWKVGYEKGEFTVMVRPPLPVKE